MSTAAVPMAKPMDSVGLRHGPSTSTGSLDHHGGLEHTPPSPRSCSIRHIPQSRPQPRVSECGFAAGKHEATTLGSSGPRNEELDDTLSYLDGSIHRADRRLLLVQFDDN